MPNNPDFPAFDYFEAEFDKDGGLVRRGDVDRLLDYLHKDGSGTTDLFVMSHGWNNDYEDARGLYRDFFNHVRGVLDHGKIAGLDRRKFAVLAVLWPSKKFGDDELDMTAAAAAGQAAGLAAPKAPGTADALAGKKLDVLKEAVASAPASAIVEQARALLPGIETSPGKQRRFADLIRQTVAPSEEGLSAGDASTAFFRLDGLELMRRLAVPAQTPPATSITHPGGAASLPATSITHPGGSPAEGSAAGVITHPGGSPAGGSAAGLGGFFSGIKGSVLHLLNYTTYYVMKERAGTVGRSGVYGVVHEVRDDFPKLKIHLLGHSFGGRLVTALTDGPAGKPPVRPDTLTLLQAAFSHNGFGLHFDGVHDGFFRAVVTGHKVRGPVLITCSVQDRAVGIAYPIASRLSGVTAAALGDKNDPFGGIGRNGAQKTPEAVDLKLLASGNGYPFTAGKLFNLNADAIITGHSDICRDEVATAVLTAVGMS